MVAEYINREALLNKIWMGNSDSIVLRSYAAEMVNVIPSADVVEVKHGKWTYDPNAYDWEIGGWCCSLCYCKNDNLGGNNPDINPYWYAGAKYCPNCGAKMDGKE